MRRWITKSMISSHLSIGVSRLQLLRAVIDSKIVEKMRHGNRDVKANCREQLADRDYCRIDEDAANQGKTSDSKF